MHMSCKCECKFYSKKCNLNQKWSNDECWWECKNLKEYRLCKKIIFEILQQVVVKMIDM